MRAWVMEAAIARERPEFAREVLTEAMSLHRVITPPKSRASAMEMLLQRAASLGEDEVKAVAEALLDAAAILTADATKKWRKWGRSFINRTAWILSRRHRSLARRLFTDRFGLTHAEAIMARHDAQRASANDAGAGIRLRSMFSSLAEQPLSALLSSIASKTPTPGGGAVASIVGALGAALGQMVVSYSIGKKSLSAHQEELLTADRALTNARRVLVKLGDEDAAAYGLVNELSRLPEGDERRRREYAGACEAAALVPMAVMGACADVLRLFERLATITNPQLRSDLGIAAVLAEAAIRASRWNVLVNTPALAAEHGARLMEQAAALEREAGERRARVEGLCGRA